MHMLSEDDLDLRRDISPGSGTLAEKWQYRQRRSHAFVTCRNTVSI